MNKPYYCPCCGPVDSIEADHQFEEAPCALCGAPIVGHPRLLSIIAIGEAAVAVEVLARERDIQVETQRGTEAASRACNAVANAVMTEERLIAKYVDRFPPLDDGGGK